MRRSKFIALLLVCVFILGNISTAFASTDNTELHNYTSANKDATKVAAGTFIGGVAAAASTETALTAVGTGVATTITAATGLEVSPVVVGAVIVSGAAAAAVYAVNRFIDWIW